jgi:hypothetical protein
MGIRAGDILALSFEQVTALTVCAAGVLLFAGLRSG